MSDVGTKADSGRTYLYGFDAARHRDFHRNIHVLRGDGSGGVTCTQSTGKSTIPGRDACRDRKSQTVDFSIMFQLHDILDLDLDSLASRDIPDAGAEDISGMLFQQACGLVSANGSLVCRARVLFFLNDTLDETLADIAPEGYDCAGFVQRECVLGTGNRRNGGRVDERLGEQSAGGGVVEFCERRQGDLREPLRRPRGVVEIFDVDTSVCGGERRHICCVGDRMRLSLYGRKTSARSFPSNPQLTVFVNSESKLIRGDI